MLGYSIKIRKTSSPVKQAVKNVRNHALSAVSTTAKAGANRLHSAAIALSQVSAKTAPKRSIFGGK